MQAALIGTIWGTSPGQPMATWSTNLPGGWKRATRCNIKTKLFFFCSDTATPVPIMTPFSTTSPTNRALIINHLHNLRKILGAKNETPWCSEQKFKCFFGWKNRYSLCYCLKLHWNRRFSNRLWHGTYARVQTSVPGPDTQSAIIIIIITFLIIINL